MKRSIGFECIFGNQIPQRIDSGTRLLTELPRRKLLGVKGKQLKLGFHEHGRSVLNPIAGGLEGLFQLPAQEYLTRFGEINAPFGSVSEDFAAAFGFATLLLPLIRSLLPWKEFGK